MVILLQIWLLWNYIYVKKWTTMTSMVINLYEMKPKTQIIYNLNCWQYKLLKSSGFHLHIMSI